MNPITEFCHGTAYLWRGFGLLGEPALRRYVILPIVVNVALIGLSLALIGWQLDAWLDAWLAALPDWLAWLETLLWWLGLILFALLFCYMFTLLANLIASPFNGMLSARVERLVAGCEPESGLTLAGEMADGVFGELRRLRYYVGRAIRLALVSALLFFVPPANLAIAPMWFVFGALMLAFEYIDLPMGNRGLAFEAKIAYLKARRWRHLGFGSTVTLVAVIPLANLVLVPAAVIGATLLYLDTSARSATTDKPTRRGGAAA